MAKLEAKNKKKREDRGIADEEKGDESGIQFGTGDGEEAGEVEGDERRSDDEAKYVDRSEAEDEEE